MSGHQFGKWTYSRTRKLWQRKCLVGNGMCTAMETAARGRLPRDARNK